MVCALCVGCGYGALSDEAYGYAEAVFGVAGRKAAERVEAITADIGAAERDGRLRAHEATWLRTMLDDCRAERWSEAQRAARAMMESQQRPPTG
ncbi:MAG: hypothetical protein ACRCT8_11695 [Lacipirellulaceae bacterium]